MGGKTVIIVQARMTSNRLPGKVTLPLCGRPLLEHVLCRARAVEGADGVCLAIPDGQADEPLAAIAREVGEVQVVRGSEQNVLSRFAKAIGETGAGTVVRITSDCPYFDPRLCKGLIELKRATGFAYVRNAFDTGLPHGFDMEVVDAACLLEAVESDPDDYEVEHVTPFLWRRPERFPSLLVDHRPNRRHWRLTVDTEADYRLAQEIYARLYPDNRLFGYDDLAALMLREPELLDINSGTAQTPYAGSPDGAE